MDPLVDLYNFGIIQAEYINNFSQRENMCLVLQKRATIYF